ncbi:MAG TPA: hypothetical protein VL358_00860 [Caulobacteraceae bacterium]|nr:hypothetical protein [Caulobacteraceae bacterium]
MSFARFLTYENRLAKIIVAPGGKRASAAVNDAEAGLLAMAGACLVEIDRLIATLTEGAGTLGRPVGRNDPLYVAAREIAGLGGLCKRPQLGEAAHSLCVLIDHFEAAANWRPEAISVHVSTIQLLRGMPVSEDNAVQQQLVESLRDMVKRLSDEDCASNRP